MDSNPYAFNRDVSYPTCAGFPRNMTCKDILEAHIQVVIPEKVSDGRGDFTAEVEDIFDHYRLPHISSEKILNRWHQSPMDFYQNQVNLAVWLATSGCGVSWRDHLDIDRPLARSVFRFHVYYQVRRILEELQAPLPQDRAWSPFQNPYDRRAYERICREFGVDPATDWRANGPNHGLGQVYFYVSHTGYRPIYGVGDPNHYDPSRMSFSQNTTNSIVHVDYIAQGPEADEAWSTFILDKSQGFTAPGVERLNDSIRTYVWAILGAQAQTRSAILGAGTSFDAQKQFLANVEDAISSPADIPSAIERYQSVLQNASPKVDYAFSTGLYMAPSDMRLHIGTAIAGYNNRIIIAPAGHTRDLPWHQQHPSASPRQDWRNGAGGTPNPQHLQCHDHDTQCRSSHPSSSCFATANTKSAGSRGRKNGPCRRRSSARASGADTSVTYEAPLGVLDSSCRSQEEQATNGYHQSPHVLGEPSGGLPQGAEGPGDDAPNDERAAMRFATMVLAGPTNLRETTGQLSEPVASACWRLIGLVEYLAYSGAIAEL